MFNKLLFVCLVLFSSTCFASLNQVSFEGEYDCRGVEIDPETSFHCEMVIKKTGETYASTAKCDDGTLYRGNGIYIEKTNAIASAFGEPTRGGEPGVTVSYFKNDGTVNTDWTYLNTTKIGHTFCTKKKFNKQHSS